MIKISIEKIKMDIIRYFYTLVLEYIPIYPSESNEQNFSNLFFQSI